MEENVNIQTMEPANDELTQRIANRLGERQRKLQQMEQWEQQSRRPSFRLSALAFVAAACVAALFVFAPWKTVSPVDELGISPNMEEYRSASPELAELQRLMEKPDYKAALLYAEKALAKSDKEVRVMMEVFDVYEDEEMEYEEQLEREINSQLRWTYIYLLVKNDRNDVAIKQLKLYLKDKAYSEHRDEASALLKKLKKK